MASQASGSRPYTYFALLVGAGGLVAAALWSATYGGSMAMGRFLSAHESWPLLFGALGLVSCALVAWARQDRASMFSGRNHPTGQERPARQDSFRSRAERLGILRRQTADDDATLQLLDNLSTGIALLDQDSTVLRVNLTFCVLFSVKPEAVEGKSLRDGLPAPFLARWSPRSLRRGAGRGAQGTGTELAAVA